MAARYTALFFTLVFILVAAVACSLFPQGLAFNAPGARDLIQYWSAGRLFEQGLNPYDGVAIFGLQKEVDPSLGSPVMMWNPPWTVLLLGPVLLFPFGISALLWLLLQIFLLFVLALRAPAALHRSTPSILVSGCIAVLFYPVHDCIAWGQISLALTLAVFGFLYFESRHKYVVAGLCLVPLSVKPHLFFLCIIPGFVWFKGLPGRAKREFLLGAFGGLAGVITLSSWLWPQSIEWWFHAHMSPPSAPGMVTTSNWQTATLSSAIRSFLSTPNGGTPSWPQWVVPFIAFLSVSITFLKSKREVRWQVVAPYILCLSLVTNSYGWLFDQSVLLVVQYALILDAFLIVERLKRYGALSLIALVQIVAVFINQQPGGTAQHHFAWLPFALLILLLVVDRLKGRPVSEARLS